MNVVELRYRYQTNKAILTINGDKVSQYSKINLLLNMPFVEIIDSLIKKIDEEVYDDYCLNIYASEFQCYLIKKCIVNSEYCKKLNCYDFDAIFSPQELFRGIDLICEKNNVINFEDRFLNIYVSDKKYCEYLNDSFIESDINSADLGIFDEINKAQESGIKYSIVICNELKVVHTNNIIIETPIDLLPKFLEYWWIENELTYRINNRIKALGYVNLSKCDNVELEVYKTGKPNYFLGDMPTSMDVGDCCEIQFRSFPQDFFSLRVEEESASISDGVLIAKKEGNTNICVVRNDGTIENVHYISMVKHVYVNNIVLTPRFDYLKKNENGKIDISIEPQNAEDVDEIILESSNDNIVKVDERGNVYALSVGSAIITASTKKIKNYLNVVVKGNIQELRIIPQYLQIKRGDIQIVESQIYPIDAAIGELVWEIDNRSIANINPSIDSRRCQVIAATQYEGKGNIRCYDPVTRIGAICNIEVVSNENKNKLGNLAIGLWLLGIIIPVLLPVSLIIGFSGLSKDEDPNHKGKYIVAIVGSIITGLLWIGLLG